MHTGSALRNVLILLLAACVAAGPVAAEKPEGKPGKHGNKQADKERKRAAKAYEHGGPSKKGRDKASHREDKHDARAGNDRRRDVRVGGYFDDRHRESARAYYTQHFGDRRGCPPGLAKKNNGCMPPGQAKKYRMGQPLPRDVVYYPVPQPVLVQLPAVPAGYRYVRVGHDILLLSPQTTLVIDVIVNIFG